MALLIEHETQQSFVIGVNANGELGLGDKKQRKTLAIPDGGALKLNVGIPLNPQVIVKKMHWFKEVFYLGSRALESIICFIGFPNLYSTNIDWVKKIIMNIGRSENGNGNLTDRATPIKGSFQLKAYLHDRDYTSYVIDI